MSWHLDPAEAWLPPGGWVAGLCVDVEPGRVIIRDRAQALVFVQAVLGEPTLRPVSAPRHDSTSEISTPGWTLRVRRGVGCLRCSPRRPAGTS